MTEDKLNDDLLLESFFSAAKTQEINDDGFTEKVMSNLPDRVSKLSQYWTAFCIVAGIVLFMVFKGWQPLVGGLLAMLHTTADSTNLVTLFATIGTLTTLAVIELVHKMDSQLSL